MLAVAYTGSIAGPQNKLGHPARRHIQTIDAGCRVECPRHITRVAGLAFRNCYYDIDSERDLYVL